MKSDKCQRCGREVLTAHLDDGSTVQLDTSRQVFVYAGRAVDGGFAARPAKHDPSKMLAVAHVCEGKK